MKRFISQLVVIASVIFIAASCQQAPFITMTGPRSYTFTRDGGTQSFSFACNREWSVSSTESWITISPSKGSATDGETKVTITCSPNTTYDARSATITVKTEDLSESITITQDTGIGLIVSPKTFDLTNAEQTIEIEVQKNVQYTVAIDNACADWIKQGGTKALTTDKITFTIAANKTYDNREGKITFKQLDGSLSETVVVRQNQTNGIFITTPTYDLSNAEHTLSVEVKANVEFEVTSQADWIKYVETKALTPSTVTLTIEANESYDNRTGTVLVKQTNGDLSGTITIKQHQTDGLFVTPDSFDLSNEEHTIELEIQKNVDFTVVIPEDAKDWIYQPTKGNTKALVGDRVILVVSANSTYDDREASVTIKQINGSLAETVKIKQAYGEGLIVEKTEYVVSGDSGELEIGVKSNVEFEVKSDVDWIHYIQTKALDSKTIYLTVDYNNGLSNRTGKIKVSQVNGPLTADIKIIQEIPIAVDLGLSVKWGSFNLGASVPEMYGYFFRWGEIEPKTDFSTPYKWGMSSDYTKYNYVDNKQTLELEDDAAHVILGDKWRTPTSRELDELVNNCKWTWKSINGVKGYLIESVKNSNQIFLPAAGYYWSKEHYEAESIGYYLSSSLQENRNLANTLNFHSTTSIYNNRGLLRDGNGVSIRPVYGDWIHPESIELNKPSLSLSLGSAEQLVTTISPSNVTDISTTWTSSDLSVASVKPNGVVIAKKVGHTTITAKTLDNELVATCEVTIVDKILEPDAIDLGLSVKWASWNVGASSPEGCGAYFGWGEIDPKRADSQNPYDPDGHLAKYASDNIPVLEPEDDVAHVKFGGTWRMPTRAEWNELKDNCVWTWSSKNGVNGYLVSSKTNDASIFLPAAGDWGDTSLSDVGSWGFYWSSSYNITNLDAFCLDFNSDAVGKYYTHWYTRFGHSVRPVSK